MNRIVSLLVGTVVTTLQLVSATRIVENAGSARVVVIYDMEGLCGVDRAEAVQFRDPGYPAARQLLVNEVNAAIEGLRDAGVTRMTLVDAHGSGHSEPDYDLSQLPPGTSSFQQDTFADPYLDSMASDVSAIVTIGMHASAPSRGFVAHTVDGHVRWRIRQFEMNELMIVAASAARYNTAVILATGDDFLVEEAERMRTGIRTVMTKRAVDWSSARSTDCQSVYQHLRVTTADAYRRRQDIHPWNIGPGRLDSAIGFMLPEMAAAASNVPGNVLIDTNTVARGDPDFASAYQQFRLTSRIGTLGTAQTILRLALTAEPGRVAIQQARQTIPPRAVASFEGRPLPAQAQPTTYFGFR